MYFPEVQAQEPKLRQKIGGPPCTKRTSDTWESSPPRNQKAGSDPRSLLSLVRLGSPENGEAAMGPKDTVEVLIQQAQVSHLLKTLVDEGW